MNKKEIVEVLKKALVKADIFSPDNPSWLQNAAEDLYKELRKKKVLVKRGN